MSSMDTMIKSIAEKIVRNVASEDYLKEELYVSIGVTFTVLFYY
jgi:hypothetical protein